MKTIAKLKIVNNILNGGVALFFSVNIWYNIYDISAWRWNMAKNGSNRSISIRSFAIVMAVFLCAFILMSLTLVSISKKALREQVEGRMLDVSNTAAQLIDGDELEKLTEEDKGSDSYESIYKIFLVKRLRRPK